MNMMINQIALYPPVTLVTTRVRMSGGIDTRAEKLRLSYKENIRIYKF